MKQFMTQEVFDIFKAGATFFGVFVKSFFVKKLFTINLNITKGLGLFK